MEGGDEPVVGSAWIHEFTTSIERVELMPYALQLTPATGSGVGAAIGNFFVTLWNGVVALAQLVVQGLINKVSQYVVSKIALPPGWRS